MENSTGLEGGNGNKAKFIPSSFVWWYCGQMSNPLKVHTSSPSYTAEQKRVIHFHDHLPLASWRQFGGIGVKCQIRLRVILNILKSIDDKPL
ncbi:hypothetical protein TIFTF001_029876 [Ficus carica]|uniref:Uncharacterized protein n=1 Tax=Ficus carica TaxID=3494 RepID=A0AA88DT53_FICCA|nr:hypothetical protein TIFTF001_029876 [Ficus carica]